MIPDVIDDEIVQACRKLGLEPRFLFDKLASQWNDTGFSNSIEVANHWQRLWMKSGFMSLPIAARDIVSSMIGGDLH